MRRPDLASTITRSKPLAPAVLLVLVVGAGGCASSAASRAAQRGDLAALKTEIAARQRQGSLGNGEAASIARVVAEREVASASVDARERVQDARMCARDLDGALAKRMRTHDAAGGEAALARIEAGTLSESDARSFAGDAIDAWRAVGARGLVREEDREARRRALLDPAPDVRRAAMRATAIAREAGDVDVLAEAARLDPEPRVRSEATRALAAIGGPSVVARLRDLWASGDEPQREEIARAWSSFRVLPAGGRDELRVLLAAGHGGPAIDGAAAFLGRGGDDAELAASARALLARTIERAPGRDREHALAVVPTSALNDAAILAAVRAAANEDDTEVRVAALARLTESSADRAHAIADLEAFAGDRDRVMAASRARMALATAGDLRVQAWVEEDLAAPSPAARLAAAGALAALGRSARGAPLLADPDPAVRVRAACILIIADHTRPMRVSR